MGINPGTVLNAVIILDGIEVHRSLPRYDAGKSGYEAGPEVA